MKKSNFFKSFLVNGKFKNKKIQFPKVGDNIWIKFLYFQGLKVSKFYSKTFFGRCIAYKRKNLSNSLILVRNVYNRYPIELSFFLNSPFIIQILFKKKDRHFKFKKSKLFYLRVKKIAQSKVKR